MYNTRRGSGDGQKGVGSEELRVDRTVDGIKEPLIECVNSQLLLRVVIIDCLVGVRLVKKCLATSLGSFVAFRAIGNR
jgi:hypothetical protein